MPKAKTPPASPRAAGTSPVRRRKGFEAASSLLAERIRLAGESRGFAISRVLTHWAEVAGEDVAAISRPVRIAYAHQGFGATLTLLASPAHAPVLQMRLPAIRERVNACYGYAAVSRVTITQTAASGFAEARAAFAPAPKAPPAPEPDPLLAARATDVASGVLDEGLRKALAALAAHVLDRRGA